MLISFKIRNNFQKTTIHSLISLSFILIPLLLYFSPTRRLQVHQINPVTIKYILNLGHVTVLEDIDDFFVRTHYNKTEI